MSAFERKAGNNVHNLRWPPASAHLAGSEWRGAEKALSLLR
jgi:hypothetical protein